MGIRTRSDLENKIRHILLTCPFVLSKAQFLSPGRQKNKTTGQKEDIYHKTEGKTTT